MKIGISVGATLSLGNFSTARTSVNFEDEFLEKELVLQNATTVSERLKVAEELSNDIYTFVEDKLIEKIADFILRLEKEKLI